MFRVEHGLDAVGGTQTESSLSLTELAGCRKEDRSTNRSYDQRDERMTEKCEAMGGRDGRAHRTRWGVGGGVEGGSSALKGRARPGRAVRGLPASRRPCAAWGAVSPDQAFCSLGRRLGGRRTPLNAEGLCWS